MLLVTVPSPKHHGTVSGRLRRGLVAHHGGHRADDQGGARDAGRGQVAGLAGEQAGRARHDPGGERLQGGGDQGVAG